MEELNNTATTPLTPEEQNGVSSEAVSWEDQLEESLAGSTIKPGELRQGIIIDRREDGLVVDIGAKRDGFVPAEDLENLEDREFAIGDEVPVVIARFRDTDGNVELSISQALLQEDWLTAEKLLENQSIYEANVLAANRGGLTIEFGALRGFIPMSQLIGFTRIRQASERHRRLRAMVGQTIMLKVIEVNRRRRRLILSQQAAAKEWRAARRASLLEELEEGQIRRGRISQITDFGLFVNLGGLDGLVHISELSWGRIENPTEVYRPGQRVKVKVLNVDRERQRIALSIKALAPDPWESAPERYQVGSLVMGKVSQVVDFGSFIELEPGVEGLLHNSELRDFEQREELEANAELLVKIIRVEPERRRIGLSVRQVRPEEWEDWVIAQAEAEETARLQAEQDALNGSTVDDDADTDEDEDIDIDDDDDDFGEEVSVDATEEASEPAVAEDVPDDFGEEASVDATEEASEPAVAEDVSDDFGEEASVDAAEEAAEPAVAEDVPDAPPPEDTKAAVVVEAVDSTEVSADSEQDAGVSVTTDDAVVAEEEE
ncbi:MAG: S1 RNA-binding domain-containing protein [Anaerolineae bacterium]|nr:S1 RNA-binding domain-containing protein [Anaerolineae bacterium]